MAPGENEFDTPGLHICSCTKSKISTEYMSKIAEYKFDIKNFLHVYVEVIIRKINFKNHTPYN